jgi:DNA-binding NarL/FixJ family response regulator
MLIKRRALLVDDHPVVRVGLRMALDDSGRFAIAGEAGDVATVHRLVEEMLPEIIVLDLMIGGRDGPELIEDILALHPNALILVFTSMSEASYAKRTLRAGAHGYVTKSQGLQAVVAALDRIVAGEYAYSHAVQQSLLADTAGRTSDDPLKGLSNREMQILRLLGSGLGTAEIAAELHLGLKTIGTYRERLKNKLNLQSARELEEMATSYVRQGTVASVS